MISVVLGGLVYFVIWRASVGNVQCYMICVFRVSVLLWFGVDFSGQGG